MKKIAIVTGATRLNGIGAAVCKVLAQKGIDIFSRTGLSMIKRCRGECMTKSPFVERGD